MVTADQVQRLLQGSRRLPALVVVLALLVLAGALFWTTRLLRDKICEQMASRDAEILHAVALTHTDAVKQELAELGEGLAEFSSIEDPFNQLMVLGKTSRLHHQVLGARLYDCQGHFVTCIPAHMRTGRMSAKDLAALKRLQAVSHFHPAQPLQELFYPESEDSPTDWRTEPVLEVNVPLHTSTDPKLVGVAQFIIEGQSLAFELARLDRNLLLLALAVFVVFGSILAVTLSVAFRWLRKSQNLLAERTRNLLQANQELALAAKTSAVGAVAAHLIHGLKNPLSGLQNYVTGLGNGSPEPADPDWEHAVATTRRMQSIINQVVRVLREQQGTQQYEVTVTELLDMVRSTLQSCSQKQGVRLVTRQQGEAVLDNRTTHLLHLILFNLAQNALQATPSGGSATLCARHENGEVVFDVADEGPGFPDHLKSSLFSPCASTKEGGTGIGLAISKVLANHLGARLELAISSGSGCVFTLRLPRSQSSPQSTVASSAVVG
jgi:signal transduction histidine kinase